MALTAEQEKFVVDLFAIYEKKQQINAFGKIRGDSEQALIVQYKVNELNTLRAQLVTDYNNNTAQLQADIKILSDNITK